MFRKTAESSSMDLLKNKKNPVLFSRSRATPAAGHSSTNEPNIKVPGAAVFPVLFSLKRSRVPTQSLPRGALIAFSLYREPVLTEPASDSRQKVPDLSPASSF